MGLIKLKEKPCKGTGQATGFGCGKLTLHRKYGLGLMCCYPSWLYNSDAGKVKAYKSHLKPSKPIKKVSISTELKKAHQKAKTLIHAYVMERDKNKPCISCGKPYNKTFQACHFFKAELYETLRYNLFNIHAGCQECNIFKDGNIKEYEKRLPERIGIERFENLKRLAEHDKHHSKVWSVEVLENIQQEAKRLTEKLKHERPSLFIVHKGFPERNTGHEL